MTDSALDAPTIDPDAAARLLRRIEAHHDQGGWHDDDQHLWVYVVFDHHDVVTGHHITRIMQRMGEPIRNSRYTAQPMFPPRLICKARRPEDNNPLDGLRRAALNLAYLDPKEMGDLAEAMLIFRQLLQQPGILGFAATYEAYGLKAAAIPRLLPNRPGAVGGRPDAKELRVAVLVDATDQAHRAVRWRDEPVEVTTSDMRGNTTTSLRILMDAAARRLPEVGSYEFSRRYPDADMYFDMG